MPDAGMESAVQQYERECTVDMVDIGDAEGVYTQTGRLTGYRLEVLHKGLNEHALLRAPDTSILRNKLRAKLESWAEKWERVESKREQRDELFKSKWEAERLTSEAEETLADLRGLLAATLDVSDVVDWESLEDRRPFEFEKQSRFPNVTFGEYGKPEKPKLAAKPADPEKRGFYDELKVGFFDLIIPGSKQKKIDELERKRQAVEDWNKQELASWKARVDQVTSLNKEVAAEFEAACEMYESEREAFAQAQKAINEAIRELHSRYLQKDPDAVLQNCELVLNRSRYPDCISLEFELEFNSETGILIVDYALPAKRRLPTLTKVAYVQSRNEFKESHLSESDTNKLFDDVLYQVSLRSIHELLEADVANALSAVVFNGWVEDTNPATGKSERGCLLSLQASKQQLAEIDLAKVDPKACFKLLKGVAASRLSAMTPVRPILEMKREDARFVSSYDVAATLDDGVNLAAMDWEDFEHLVRELFSKEFSFEGAEVRVTRASADGGVDAVVFDPDPIRGGKIVIQAKRYTNTVGVSAVRDLYGTVMNEGANKGILVTTADYGPDAYSFAQDKPLTLLSGSNLLHLLSKHGHKARIDLRAAKAELEGKMFGRT